MNTYIDSQYYFYQTIITFLENDTMLLENKTPFSHVKETIPLRAFHPEAKLISGKLPGFAQFLFWIELSCIVGFFITLYSEPATLAGVSVPICLLIICASVCASVFYYKHTTKKKLSFYYKNDNLSFELSQNNPALAQFLKYFKTAVAKAHVNGEEHNFTKLKKGVDSLVKQKIISEQFGEELHHRLNCEMNTKIK